MRDEGRAKVWFSACGNRSGQPAGVAFSCATAFRTVVAPGASHTDVQEWDQAVDGTAAHGVQPVPQGVYRAAALVGDGVQVDDQHVFGTTARECGAGDVSVTVTTDAPSYDEGVLVHATVTVLNTSRTECQWRHGNAIETLQALDADGRVVWSGCGGPSGLPRGQPCVHTTEGRLPHALEPGQPVVDRRDWGQRADGTDSADPTQVLPGAYTLRATTEGGLPWTGETTVRIR